MTGTGSGMELAATCYAEYGGRARELKKQGKRFIGYLCAYVPLEIIGAAGFIPFRIRGSVNEPITMADAHMETIVCPMVRSYFDNALKGAFDFIEGLVLPHSCDSMCITHDIWRTNLNLPYFHLLNIPHTAGERSHDFFLASLRTFRTSLERYAGASISDAAIREQTARYNELRAAVRRLYGLRRGPAPLITGPESVRVLVSAMSLPVEEALTMVNGVIGEASDRGPSPDTGRQRVMIVSSEQDDDTLSRIVEECGAAVVCDYTCPGMREFGTDVEAAGGPLKGLASRYLGLNCARTYFESGVGHAGDLEVRFGSIGRLAADFNVRGVVLRVHRCCDPYGLEVPSLRAYLISKGLEVLYLEDDYSMRDTGRLRTRIQAFLELVGNRPGGRKP